MQMETVNYSEVANWNDNESLSVTNLRMNRFRPWQLSNTTMINSIYYTQHYKSSCLQSLPKSSVNSYVGSENCLYLNVHVPISRKSVNQAKPVIIIIDGLFFMYSNEPNQPSSETIYKTDAIHVTFNYRIVIQTMNSALNCQHDINPNDCSSRKFNNLENILNIWNWPIVEQWLIDSVFSLPSIHELAKYKTDKLINILINDNQFVNINSWNKIIMSSSIKPMVIGQTSHEVAIYPTPKTLPFWNKNIYKNYILKKLRMKNLSTSSKYYQQFLSNNFNDLNCTQQDNDTDSGDDDDDVIDEETFHEDKDWLSNLMLLITDSRLTCPLTELVNKFTNQFHPVYQYYLTGTHRRFDPYSLKGYVSYAFHGWDAMLYLRTYEVHNDFTDPSLLQSLGIDSNVEEMNRLRKISDLLNSAMYQFSRTGFISNWYESKRGRYDVNLIENYKLCKYVNIMKKRCDFWKLLFNNNLFNSTWRF
ncbi:Para-nitrobenzyl esterase [Schistosoma japonicum]|nr:Para-nitrobenzyl esterase [Schistosoma japonicum]